MSRHRPLFIWIAFGTCAAVGLGVLAWFSREMLRLEHAHVEARAAANVEENVRLALWRMDSALASIHGLEAARPFEDYEPFHRPARVYDGHLEPLPNGAVALPSPLLGFAPPFVRLHFQLEPEGGIRSPQAPEGPARAAALEAGLDIASLDLATLSLIELRSRLQNGELGALLDLPEPGWDDLPLRAWLKGDPPPTGPSPASVSQADPLQTGATRADKELTFAFPFERPGGAAVPSQDILGESSALAAPTEGAPAAINPALSEPTAGPAPEASFAVAQQAQVSKNLAEQQQRNSLVLSNFEISALNRGGPPTLSAADETAAVRGRPEQTEARKFPEAARSKVKRPSSAGRSLAQAPAVVGPVAGAGGDSAPGTTSTTALAPSPATLAATKPEVPEATGRDGPVRFDITPLRDFAAPGSTGADTRERESTSSTASWSEAGGSAAAAPQQSESNSAWQTAERGIASAAREPSGIVSSTFTSVAAREGPLQALWAGSELVFARRVLVGDRARLQGVWLDWPRLEAWLLGRVADLLPQARLEPATATPPSSSADASRTLAFIPARLVPGPVAAANGSSLSPLRISLGAAWASAVLGAGALALLLHGTLQLSERRGAFVSAVTHELRTPLTTFRMYTEMLTGGMVADETRRRSYLETLRKEAERLSHLVENVLSYARLERGRASSRVEETTPAALLGRIEERLRQRAEQGGQALLVAFAPGTEDRPLRTDLTAVEQILFNLVDNAAKYARPLPVAGFGVPGPSAKTSPTEAPPPATITVAVDHSPGGAGLLFRVIDRGPGLPAAARKRLFQPFSKSATEAAHSQPGVGLGLALSRRLARDELQGELTLERTGPDGTVFRLELP